MTIIFTSTFKVSEIKLFFRYYGETFKKYFKLEEKTKDYIKEKYEIEEEDLIDYLISHIRFYTNKFNKYDKNIYATIIRVPKDLKYIQAFELIENGNLDIGRTNTISKFINICLDSISLNERLGGKISGN